MFDRCTALESVSLPGGHKRNTIGYYAFRGCTARKKITIPKDCGSVCIDNNAFDGCKLLTGIQNADAIKRVGSQAFRNCKSLKTVTFSDQPDDVVRNAFSGCTNLKTVYLNSTKASVLNKHNRSADWTNYCSGEQETPAPLSELNFDTIACSFTEYLPKASAVYVRTKAMKQAVQKAGCVGTVKVTVSVSAPKTLKATQKSGKVTLTWSAVKSVTGYRVYACNAKTGTTRLARKTTAKQFAIRAYRNIDSDNSWSAIRLSNKLK